MSCAPRRARARVLACACVLWSCSAPSDRPVLPSRTAQPPSAIADAGAPGDIDAGAAGDAGVSSAEPEWPLEMVATLLPAERALDVRLDLALGWVPPPRGTDASAWGGVSGATLTFADDLPFATGRGFAQFVTVAGEGGQRTSWPARITVTDGRLSIAYRVALRHHEASPARGLDEVPHPTRGGWFLAGRAFVPRHIRLADGRALDVAGQLTIRAPSGWTIVGSPDREGDVFRASSFRGLADAVFALGDLRSTHVRVGEVDIAIVTSDFDEEVLDRMADLVRRILTEGQALLGPLPPSRLLVVHDRSAAGIDGGVVGRSIAVLTEHAPTGRAREDAAIVTVHELMHLWNRSEAWWINEGMTRYLEVLLSLRLDRADEAAAMAAWLPVVRRYEAEAEGQTIAASTGAWGYAAGAVAMFCADTHLRRTTQTTLLEVHRRARTQGVAPGGGNTVSADALLSALDAASADTGAYVRALVAQRGSIDVDACFARAGYALSRARRRARRMRGRDDRAWPFAWRDVNTARP
ncbi:MAG: hypothetical protein IT379_20480 [Deltaproteobacteria bacterium]|nr:hypothetical protein [Deltaproteobacteria bacterium]